MLERTQAVRAHLREIRPDRVLLEVANIQMFPVCLYGVALSDGRRLKPADGAAILPPARPREPLEFRLLEYMADPGVDLTGMPSDGLMLLHR